MLDDLYRIWMFSVFVGEVLCVLALVIGLLWLRRSRTELRAGTGGRLQVAIAGSLVAATIVGALGLAVVGGWGVPWLIDVLERQQVARQEQTALQTALIDQPAPHLAFKAVTDDRAYHLDDFAGQVRLVNFWATWCGPCIKEMPDLERLQRDLGGRGLKVIHLSEESRDKLADYLEENAPANLHAYGDTRQWPSYALPTTFIVDRAGFMRKVHTGMSDYDTFVGLVEPHL